MRVNRGIKRGFLPVLAVVLLLAAGLSGCKDSPATTAYNTLLTAQGVYEAGWGMFKDLYEEGLVSDGDFQKGRTLAIDYYNAWNLAVEAAMTYQAYLDKGENVPNGIEGALSVAMERFREVGDAFFDFIKKK